MKSIPSISTIILLAASTSLPAQQLEPQESTIMHREALRPCVEVVVEVDPDPLKKEWIDYIDNQYGVSMDGMGLFANKELLTAEEVNIKRISKKTIDFFTEVVGNGNGGSEMKVFAAEGYDIYIGRKGNARGLRAMKDIIKAFLKQYLPKYYKSSVEEKQDLVSDLTRDTEKLNEDITDANEEIEKLKENIAEWQNTLEEKRQALEKAKLDLDQKKARQSAILNTLRKF